MDYKLILVEGIDGSGKGAIIKNFKEIAKSQNLKVFDLKSYIKETNDFPEYEKIKEYDLIISGEPTYSWIGKAIREELIRDNKRNYSALSVAQAYALDRKILYKRLLIRALEDKKIVIEDRSVISSIAYQPLQAETQGENLPLEEVLNLKGNKQAIEDYPPSDVIIAKINPETALERLTNRTKDDSCIFEKLEFMKKLQERYSSNWLKELFEKQGSRVTYLDTGSTLEKTKEQVEKIWNENIKGVEK